MARAVPYIYADLHGAVSKQDWNNFANCVVSISGNLQTQITDNYSTIASISSSLDARITTNTNNISYLGSISGDLARKNEENTFTQPNIFSSNVSISGKLTVGGNISGSNNVVEVLDISGNIVEKVTAEGFKSIRYRDEYVGGEWVLGAGGGSPDVTTVTISGFGYRVYGFDGGNTLENMSNSFEIPHDVAFDEVNNETVFMEAHVHWMPSTNNSGDVIWYFNWAYLPLNGAPIAQSQLSVTVSVSANEQYYHKISGFESGGIVKIPKPSTGFTLGDIILFDLRRVPTTDTYPNDALLLKCALHVPTNDFGSRQRYIK